MIYIGGERAEALVEKLPDDVRAEVKKILDAALDKGEEAVTRTEPEVIVDAASVFKKADWYGAIMAEDFLDGLKPYQIKAALSNKDEFFFENPILTVNIEDNFFCIDDLVMLDDRAMQKVLREVDQQVLVKAMKGMDTETQDKIFRNMSQRATQMLREDFEFIGPVRISDVEDAQSEIIVIVLRLENSGDIVIARANEDELI